MIVSDNAVVEQVFRRYDATSKEAMPYLLEAMPYLFISINSGVVFSALNSRVMLHLCTGTTTSTQAVMHGDK
jgi:hypothetical protein